MTSPSVDDAKITLRHSVGIDATTAEAVRMKFVLTYTGPLRSDGNRKQKHAIRKAIHPQLAKQWTVEPPLVTIANHYSLDTMAGQFARGAFCCVPLVSRALKLACRLEILMLREEEPGGFSYLSGAVPGPIKSGGGDIDNRLKTLFDSLSIPQVDQVRDMSPEAGENPFHCLLEDDSLISSVDVRTDRLLSPLQPGDVVLIITVHVAPTTLTHQNMAFLGGAL